MCVSIHYMYVRSQTILNMQPLYILYPARRNILFYYYYYPDPQHFVEMPEYRKKVSPASLVLPLVRRVSPASVFRHQPQSGTAGHGLTR
jgi:hypothetical protein